MNHLSGVRPMAAFVMFVLAEFGGKLPFQGECIRSHRPPNADQRGEATRPIHALLVRGMEVGVILDKRVQMPMSSDLLFTDSFSAPILFVTFILSTLIKGKCMSKRAVASILASVSFIVVLLSGVFASTLSAAASNPAVNSPDEVAWSLFLQVNQPTSSGASTFETWASDTETFKPNPTWPTGVVTLKLHAPVIPALGKAMKLKGAAFHIELAPGAGSGISEETRRNKPAFDFIVTNKLFSKSGLAAAFGKTVSFPVESLEVKANWLPVSDVPHFTLNRVAAADVGKFFHISSDAAGNKYALLSMHVISKQVPNWTWATFENQFNPSRCDILGCRDNFGATKPVVSPNASAGSGYPPCEKTDELRQMFKNVNADSVFVSYCLKGAQVDFTDNTGLAIRVGNSITENGFVQYSSCITCHSSAGWDNVGAMVHSAGFFGPGGNPIVGAMQPNWFWTYKGQPPVNQGQTGNAIIATEADFVWSIPFCAYDDSNPVAPKVSRCAGK